MVKYNKEDFKRLDGLFNCICGFDKFEGIEFSVGDVEDCGIIDIEFTDDVEDKFKNTVYKTVANFITLSGFEFKGELNEFGIIIKFEGFDEVDYINTLYDNYIEE